MDGGWLVGVGLGESDGYEYYGGGSEGVDSALSPLD
jgi:hypothetical protein